MSRSAFDGDEVCVEGFPWCPSPTRVGVASLTAKVLCRYHNSGLSDTDIAARDVRRAFGQSAQVSLAAHSAIPTVGGMHHVMLQGSEWERWCLKTLINVSFNGRYAIGKDASKPGEVGSSLVECAFGRRAFKHPIGLYYLGEPGDEFVSISWLRIAPFIEDSRIYGGLFVIRGFSFALLLEDRGSVDFLSVLRGGSPLTNPSRLCYHPAHIGMAIEKVKWCFDFHWR